MSRTTRLRPFRIFPLLALSLAAEAGAQQAAPDAAAPALSQPTLSPDGREVVFVSGGDLWIVPAQGGTARLLVSHAANESRPLFDPAGARLAFVSDRGGSDDLFVLDLGTSEVRRLTWSDGPDHLDAWSADGAWLYFTAADHDVGGMTDVLRISAEGGSPIPVAAAEYQPEYHAAPAPDGRTVAVAGRARMGYSQWWRNGSSHIDEAEIWLVEAGERPSYRRLTEPGAKHLWPQWLPDCRSLLYMSDRGGSENLWVHAEGSAPRPLTRFSSGRVLWPSLGGGGRTVVFERDFGIWRMALEGGEPAPLPIRLGGAAQGPTVERLTLRDDFSDLALSPDGKKVAFVARGDVFAAPAGEGGPAVRLTSTVALESEVAWAPDSRRLAFVSERTGTPRLYLHDVASGEERPLTGGSAAEATPAWSPDGTRIALAREGRELVVVEVESGRERVLARANLWRPPFSSARPLAWSPDGRWLAFLAGDDRMFTNVQVVPADGGEPARPVSRLANSSAASLAWAPDGSALYFDSQHRTEDGQIARVDLRKRTPAFRETEFDRLFEERGGDPDSAAAAGGAPEPARVEIDFEGILERVSLLPLGVDAGMLSVSPDGKTLVFAASAEGQTNLYSFPLDPLADGPAVARQLTATPGGKGLPQFSPDGKRVFHLDRGRVASVGTDGDGARILDLAAETEVDFHAEKREVFAQGWRYLRDHFYDEGMHGVDWEAVRGRFAPRVAAARTREELERLMDLMVGELNASHLGHTEPTGRRAETGRLGVRLDAAAYRDEGVFRVAEVLPLGPADVAGLRPGDVLLAVDGQALERSTNLDRLLESRVGDRVEVRVRGSGEERTVALQPVSTSAERRLAYREWVRDRRDYVHRASGGRLGYVHMPDMGWESLQQLIVDLDAENFARDGVVIDVRANNGGFVNAYALDVFARRGYITMEVRGYPTVPARSALGQRALEAPTALVTDLNSLSDAEDFAEGYRTLDLGPVVGEPTAGWIIYTWGLELVDGSAFRMPRSRIRASDGEVMELNPRPVDLPVERPLGESYRERDSQLDAAVRALLERIGT